MFTVEVPGIDTIEGDTPLEGAQRSPFQRRSASVQIVWRVAIVSL
jgi:hypothetical protein